MHGFGSAFAAVLAVSPALPLLVFARPSRLFGVERALLAFIVLYTAIFFGSHVGPLSLGLLHSVGFSSRNLLLVGAAAPLLLGRVLERCSPDSPARLRFALLATVALIGAGPLLAAPGMDAEGYSVAGIRRARPARDDRNPRPRSAKPLAGTRCTRTATRSVRTSPAPTHCPESGSATCYRRISSGP